MGNKQSIDIYDPDDDDSVAPADAAQLQAAAKASPLGARLYKFEREKNPPWVLVGVVDPDFVNDADNEEDDAPEWYFHVRPRHGDDQPARLATFIPRLRSSAAPRGPSCPVAARVPRGPSSSHTLWSRLP